MRTLALLLILAAIAGPLAAQDVGYGGLERRETSGITGLDARLARAAAGNSAELRSLVRERGAWDISERLLLLALQVPVTVRQVGAVSAAVQVVKTANSKELLTAASEALLYLMVLSQREPERKPVGSAARVGLIELGWVLRLESDRITLISAPVEGFPRALLFERVRWTRLGSGTAGAFGAGGVGAFSDPDGETGTGQETSTARQTARPSFGHEAGPSSDSGDESGRTVTSGSAGTRRGPNIDPEKWKAFQRGFRGETDSDREKGPSFWSKVKDWFRDQFCGPSLGEQIGEGIRKARERQGR